MTSAFEGTDIRFRVLCWWASCWFCVTPVIGSVPASESYQTLQEPGWPGDDDKNLLHQFGDDGHLLALWTLIRLIVKGQKGRMMDYYCDLIQLAQAMRQHSSSTEAVYALVWLLLFLACISSSYIICWWFNGSGLVFQHLASILISGRCLGRVLNNRKHLEYTFIKSHCLHI